MVSSVPKTEKLSAEGSTIHSCETCGHRFDNVICSTSIDVRKLLDQTKIKTVFRNNQIIFYQGGAPLGLYVVTSGLVKVEATSEQGQKHTLRYFGPGSVLGYRTLFANEIYQSTAIAAEKSEICFFPKAVVMDVFKNNPQIAFSLLEVLSRDLGQAERRWTNQMDKEASERIAEALVFLHENFSHLNWTRREIAEWAGTSPETVIRTLAQFEKDGYIDQSEGRVVKILDRDSLMNQFELKF